ncbi:glucose-6-phosphate isomerase [Garciella nitratireducens]|uniref:Glucose-6-phosphate isomerase n=1 Tax=Garciella nitratireducens DSM 15102 TaxID=1121911 RepID=A0A1T4NP96_9FIRM|nr:glucose-6-phosphate isomerase [Garciella nitratireducens]SJZ81039.1 glucose-6-phosphate isomerase [Garciella nitratireducens DSM 15102]
MNNLTFNYSHALIQEHELEEMQAQIQAAHNLLHQKIGAGSDFTGWVEYPHTYDKEEYIRVQKAAEKIKKDSEVLVVIGIGGSYLGARAVIESLSHSFSHLIPQKNRQGVSVFFAGNNISGSYLKDLLDLIQEKDFSINVISKSGTTTEPAIAFRIFKDLLEKKYGKEGAKERIYVTTDKEKGALRKLCEKEGYESFVIPNGLGGRYSVLSAVGLLPIAAAGIDTDKLLDGARDAVKEYQDADVKKNPCYQYAAIRNILNRKGKELEIFVSYEPCFNYFAEWWKQLFGESEGKDGKGIFPASASFSTDLHSLGQIIQDGKNNKFETVVWVKEPNKDVEIIHDKENSDGLNFISGKTLNYVNKMAFQGTLLAHVDGNVPNLIIEIPKLDEYYMGKMIYFFEKACGISGYILGVNPFNQPGVEAYKKNMYALLGKPGFEELQSQLKERIKK